MQAVARVKYRKHMIMQDVFKYTILSRNTCQHTIIQAAVKVKYPVDVCQSRHNYTDYSQVHGWGVACHDSTDVI